MEKPKNRRINLRFNDDEFAQLEELASGKKLATYCRDVILDKKVKVKRGRTKYQNLHPDLLRELNSIGNNLNQIVRLAHQANKNNSLELLQLNYSLSLIQRTLAELVKEAKENAHAS